VINKAGEKIQVEFPILSAGVQKEINARVQKETILQRVISEDFWPVVERRYRGLSYGPELTEGMMDEGDA